MVMKNTDIVTVSREFTMVGILIWLTLSPTKYAYNNVWLLFGYQQQK